MLKAIKLVLSAIFLCGLQLHAQTSNKVWFVMWNGQPTPSGDVAVQNITANGSGSAVSSAAAVNFISQTNFLFNSPYDIAVDVAMGKVYVLDNNVQGITPEYIYSYNLAGTPAQIAASAQIIYTMPVSQTDSNENTYPLISSIALDSTNHFLYFNQIDSLTSSNSYVGRLSLTSSSLSDVLSSNTNNPTLQTFYVGQIPGQGSIAIDSTNIYIGAINGNNGVNGVFAAPVSGSGAFSELVAISTNNLTFTNGLIGGIASYPQSNLVYYLTFDGNGGGINPNFSTNQNAIWTYNTVTHVKTLIASGYQGYPDNIAIDAANKRYYFTLGRDGTATATISPTNHQAIFTGIIGSAAAPALFYTPLLNGQDTNANTGNVTVQGIYVVDTANLQPPIAGSILVDAEKNWTLNLPLTNLISNASDPNGYSLSVTAVSSTSTNGGSVSLNGNFISYTPITNYIGRDRFNYTLTDSGGAQAQGSVSVNVLALNIPSSNNLAVAIAPAGYFLLYVGSANQNYVIQFANSIKGPWIDLSPALTSTGIGSVEYNDLTSPSASRFYRVRVGP